MELPKDLSWELTTNENGVEMITMPKFKMNEIVEYLKYADTELKKLRVADVSVSDCVLNNEYNHFMDIDTIGACSKCGSMKQYGH
jgi:hypothetical protein